MNMSYDYKELVGKLINENGNLKSELYRLVKEYPNDMMLGEQVRMLVNEMNDEWRISQFNRNRPIEDQVSTIEEMESKVDEIFNS